MSWYESSTVSSTHHMPISFLLHFQLPSRLTQISLSFSLKPGHKTSQWISPPADSMASNAVHVAQVRHISLKDHLIRLHVCMLSRFSHVWLCKTPWTVALQAPLSMGFSRQEYWSGLHALLQGIFPTQGSNPRLLHLLCCQAGSLPLAPPGKPLIRLLLGLKQCSDSSLNQISLVYIQGPLQLDQNFFSFLSQLFSLT